MATVRDRRTKWSDHYYVKAYQLAVQGYSNQQIGRALGANTPETFIRWCKRRPALRAAIQAGRDQRDTAATFTDFVYDRLPEHLQRLWRRLDMLNDDELSGPDKVEAMFEGHGVRVRQHLFLHAYIRCNFNPSAACRAVGISRGTLRTWAEHDPQFPELMQELDWHRKNWLEEHLFKLIASGDSGATIFANRTINRDRGYDSKKTIEVTGKVEHNHNLIDLDSLDLPHEVRLYILEAMRCKREGEAAPAVPQLPNMPDPRLITVEAFEGAAPDVPCPASSTATD